MILSLFFTPFVSYLVYIHTLNFVQNQTTTSRYAQSRRENATREAIASLAGYELSDWEDEDLD